MPLKLGRSGVPPRGCIDVEKRVDALAEIVNEFNVGPTTSSDDDTVTIIYVNEAGDIVNRDGDIVVAGTSYTAGLGIDVSDLAGGVIQVEIGTGLAFSGNVLVATGSPTVSLIAGAFIDADALADDDTIAVYLGLDKPGLEGDGETPEGLRSKSRFVLVTGQLTAAVDHDTTSTTIDNVVAWIGENPTDLLTDELPVTCSPRINAGNNVQIWAVYDGQIDSWYTGTALNETYILRGKSGYASEEQYLAHEVDGTILWKVPDVTYEIWGLDPGGGHTLSVSGTTVTINLKILKVSGVFVSEPTVEADDISITHTGTECDD